MSIGRRAEGAWELSAGGRQPLANLGRADVSNGRAELGRMFPKLNLTRFVLEIGE